MIFGQNIKHILIRVPNWIGDAVLSLPAIEALKAAYPAAEITVLARPWVSPIFFNNPSIKMIIDYDKKKMHRGISGRIKLIREIKKRGFDMAVLFQNAFEAALFAFLARIPIRIGYARDLRGFLLTHLIRIGQDIKKAHQVFYYLNIVDKAGSRPVARSHRPKIYLTEEEKGWAADFVNKNSMGDGIVVGIAPGASYGPAKRWPAERFHETARKLANDYRAISVLFGGADDREICDNVLGANGLNLSGELDLRKSAAMISKCDVFITNDSGLMHIAASLGVPTVAIFGSTDPVLTGPVGDNVAVIKKDIECNPCFERECRYGHYNCMKMVNVQDVYDAAMCVLKKINKE